MRLLCQKLSEMGYRKPGLALSQSLDDRVLHQWLGGFMVPAQNSSPNHRVPLFVVPDDKWNRQRFLAWLHRQQPDVVIGHQEELLEWMRQAGIKVPQQMGFVHLDCPAPDGPISGIYQNGTEIGIAAADALVAMLQRNERGVPQYPRTLLIEGSWVKGTTARPSISLPQSSSDRDAQPVTFLSRGMRSKRAAQAEGLTHTSPGQRPGFDQRFAIAGHRPAS